PAGWEAKTQRAGVAQAAIHAVVDIERVAPAQLHLDDDRAAAGDERPPGFGPQRDFRGESSGSRRDRGDVVVERWRCHVGIADGKAAADIDNVDGDPAASDRLA